MGVYTTIDPANGQEFARYPEISDDELDDEGGEGDPEDSLADLVEGVRLVKSAESGVAGVARAMSGALNVQ